MKVAIIGGGIAGLYAASILKERNYSVQLFEATDRLGGRVYTKQLHEHQFIELGAAEIHGKSAVIHEMLTHLGQKLEPIVGDEFVWFNKRLTDTEELHDLPPIVQDIFNYFENIDQETYDGTVLQVLKQKGLYNAHVRHIIRGFLSEYSTDAEKAHAFSLGEDEWRWSSGDRNYFSWGKYSDAIDFFVKKLKSNIFTSSAVVDVNYLEDSVQLLLHDGTVHTFDKVIITASLGALKEGKINFTPALPQNKQTAIETLGFGKGRKLFIEFDSPFWEEDTVEIIGGEKCPMYLIRPSHPNHIVAFLMGDASEEFNQLNDDELAEILINELDEMYPKHQVMSLYKSHFGQDWSKQQYTCGTYSFATKNANEHRAALKEPINNKIFFIGEACHTNGHVATVHGAMETAEEVVENYFAINV
ncbi:flavin monoamine oxidase family protein [Flammeovirga kamogawensis]|uniref:Tryptophan 2-monooxygenase n=1 Tax=Flammeovirga kamogawensis TaxID=373891 RepID=A0ABX8H0X7_9BACT|nr:NAD(P)/FAD-dependent oxidoreductase [Flammeovirga kamogawensis]MBB6459545.1 monoamine oxidase [Flammeovirga kamogawensis]QWG09096.1 FAD-dependent oxidoreductase [Flammeovirga kamogawensis]TRX67384.1 FAD-dependent oxidoreductase [Flammeovirga kamogawensis]